MGMFDKYLGAAAEESTTVPAAVAEASPDDSAALSLSDETKKSLQNELGSVQKKANAEKAEASNAKIAEAVRDIRVFVDQYGVPQIMAGCEAIPLESTRGFDAMRLAVYDRTGKAVGDDTLRREAGVIRAKVAREGERKVVSKRIASDGNGGVVIDLGDSSRVHVHHGMVEIEEHDGEFLFRRGPGYGTLPIPVIHDSPKEALLFLWKFVAELGVPENRRLILIVALVNALRPGVPYLILLLLGSAGAGKTTAAGILGGCIDPTTSGELPNVPLNAQDLAAVGGQHHVIGADNLSRIETDASDLLCMATHGSEFVLREFHTRGETARLPLHVQIILTAITSPVTRGDLLDRVLPIQFEKKSSYKGEEEVRAWFSSVQPQAFGALVTLLAAALQKLPEVKTQCKWKHRLVDCEQLGEAVVQVCGGKIGTFSSAFAALRHEAAQEAADGDPIIRLILDVVRKISGDAVEAEAFPPWRKWLPTAGATAIRNAGVTSVAIRASTLRERVRIGADIRTRWVPETDKAVSDVLLQKKPVLAAIGIDTERRCFNGSSGAAWVFSWSE